MLDGRASDSGSAPSGRLRAAVGFAFATGIALLLLHGGGTAALAGPAPPAAARIQDAEPSCRDCHEEVAEAAKSSIHAKVVADPVLDSCEMCHVGKAGHLKVVQGDANAKKPPLSGFTKPADCLLCHSTIPARHEKEMPAWRESKGKACTTCHDPHADAVAVKKLRSAGPFAEAAALAAEGGAKAAGMAACAKCHDAPIREFRGSDHGKALADRGEAACEACHGAASLHVASGGVGRLIVGPRKMDAAGQARFCLACHEKDAPEHAREFAKSPRSEGGKNCLSCHRVHAPAAPGPAGGFANLADAGKAATPVGSAKCAECHRDPHPALAKSRHAPVMAAGRAGCEGCHGPGSAHAASGGKRALILGPKRLEPADRDGLCLSCHVRTSSPAAWGRQPHGAAGIGCLTCHDPFAPAGRPAREPEPALCARCHSTQVALFKLPNHHPVEEGALRCSDCHDMHRAPTAVFAARKWTETCAKCHRTEAAPRLHPHEAGRADGCIACHEPHGSATPRLLRFSRPVDLCLSCHIPPPTHDLAPGAGFTNCLACHTEIHGSDADRKLLR